MPDKACLDERFKKDMVWNSREHTIGVESQAAVLTTFGCLTDTWGEHLKHAIVLCFALKPAFPFSSKTPSHDHRSSGDHDSGTSQEQKPCQLL